MSQMNRRQALQLLAALGTSGLAAGCGSDSEDPAASSGNPIKIGLIVPGTGPNKVIGEEISNGFQLFLSLNNHQLGGHPATVVTAEEGENAKSGQAAVDRLLKEGVLALTGVVSSAVMLGIRDSVEQARVPLIGSNASPTSLQSVVYIWRTSYVLDEPGRALGQYLRETLPATKRITVIAPDSQSSRDVVDGFRKGYEVNGRRIAAAPILTADIANPGKGTYGAAIGQALHQSPDVIFCHYAGPAAVQFVKQLYDGGYRGPIYAPGFLTEGTVLGELESEDASIEKWGIETALNYSADLNNTANRVFASAYRDTYRASPTTYAMASYDAAQVLDKAIRLVPGNPTSQQVNLALGKIGQIDSPRGPWQFNQPRTPQQKWYLRRVQRDGQLLSNVVINELATLG
ncbi:MULTISPECIES: ABC transporter substrate-binding protein [Micromonospora]|uniref:ABC transporter substrate-binding protein n=1 Tax=Micromonospora sicca TaxID=2202420 RepID=A0A317DUR3_9ACTN|nr:MULTISPECIES: ABC transporter substrate-binding protein [unclassified Micromonospora]MBM0228559.1 ABC transporter substrate-binding protein [Micromonospora sp. ATA51]PWR16555.1 ABC transporter substrate-binding protein [Micromonospora sp. 4G51]